MRFHPAKASLFLSACLLVGCESAAQVETQVAAAPAQLSIAAQELYEKYQAGEAAADSQYTGKVIEVTGTVADMSKDASGEINLILNSGEGKKSGVWCMYSASQNKHVAGLKVGDKVIAKGRCEGLLKSMDAVILKGCIFSSPDDAIEAVDPDDAASAASQSP